MKAHTITPKLYTQAIKLGIYEELKSLSHCDKIVTYYKPCGREEKLSITIKPVR